MGDYIPSLGLANLTNFNEQLVMGSCEQVIYTSYDEMPAYVSPNVDLQIADNHSIPQNVKKPKRGYANKRERVRTENVNAGFEKLRKLIPTDPIDRKLSKIEVLRLAVSYIKHLHNLTRASSCLEAEQRDMENSVKKELADSEDDEEVPSAGHQGFRDARQSMPKTVMGSEASGGMLKRPDNRQHVCTFCLMMSKCSSNTSPSSSSTKRK